MNDLIVKISIDINNIKMTIHSNILNDYLSKECFLYIREHEDEDPVFVKTRRRKLSIVEKDFEIYLYHETLIDNHSLFLGKNSKGYKIFETLEDMFEFCYKIQRLLLMKGRTTVEITNAIIE